MLGLGLASSHAPAMFEPAELWPTIYGKRPLFTMDSQPPGAKLETPEVINGYIQRIEAGFDTMRRQIADYRPDAIVVVGDDQADMFDSSNNPAIAIYTGDELWGLDKTFYSPMEERTKITFKCHAPLAKHLLEELLNREFDMASMANFRPLGRPERGVSHMVSQPMPKLDPDFAIPIIPIFLNEYFPPLPSAKRCFDLGVAIGDILSKRPERIAIYASGGLSHDPFGPRAGWVDEPLDRWVLERLERNDIEPLKSLYTFDSDTMRGGTGEIRAWITVAAAMNRPAKVLEYIASHHAKCGLGFAYWPALDSPKSVVEAATEALHASG
jgi:aromatic ring-opening dioxygenase catalytic subunit (LigB family)